MKPLKYFIRLIKRQNIHQTDTLYYWDLQPYKPISIATFKKYDFAKQKRAVIWAYVSTSALVLFSGTMIYLLLVIATGEWQFEDSLEQIGFTLLASGMGLYFSSLLLISVTGIRWMRNYIHENRK